MEEQQKNIDEFFRQSLQDYREAPPSAAWQDVVRRLDADAKRRPAFWRWPWVALSLLLVVGGAWVAVSLTNSRRSLAVSSATGANTAANGWASGVHTTTTAAPQPADITATEVPAPDAPKDDPPAEVAYQSPRNKLRHTISPVAPAALESKDRVQAVETVGRGEKETPVSPAPVREPVTSPSPLSYGRQRPLMHGTRGAAAAKPFGLDPTLARVTPVAEDQSIASAVAPSPAVPPKSDNLSPLARIATEEIMKVKATAAPGSLLASVTPIPDATVFNDPKTLAASSPTLLATQSPQINPSPVSVTPMPPVAAPASEPAPPAGTGEAASEQAAEVPPPASDIHIWNKRPPVNFSLLAGYDQGFGTPLVSRWLAGGRLLFPVNDKLSLGVQAAYRGAHMKTTRIGSDAGPFARSSVTVDSFRTIDASPTIRYSIDTIYNYVVRERVDSVIISAQTAGGSYWELELPLLVHYRVSDRVYVYGGPSLNIGGKVTYSPGAEAVYSSTRQDSIAQSQPRSFASFNNYFGKSRLPAYTGYRPTVYAEEPDALRIGYLVGVGVTMRRFFAEVSLQQQFNGYKNLPAEVQGIYKMPYVRLSVGYLLFGHKGVSNLFAE